MASGADVLVDGFNRVREVVHAVVEGATPEQLNLRLDDEANSITWLVWHLTRIQDDHVADAAGRQQVWTSRHWAEEFGFPFDVRATGYGQRPEEVAAARVESGEGLLAYHDEVHEQTIRFIEGLGEADLDRIVDERWDPPVSLAVRLVSVISDDLQHAGQAAFIRGMDQRASRRRA
ncbi:MAG TPA: DUF664 domain-containing protein [Actinomycetota bacterium]|jgi:hypothetical protein|nr:DUF664 domain-containing protein [Actinomycetota bacterium]